MTTETETGWRSRIVGRGEAPPESLTSNPRNWRTHPRPQLEALAGVLSEVGWVQDVLVNRTTGYVVDGHARIQLAVSRKEPTVPVVYVELSEAEEAKVLATLDPLGAMAGADPERLAALVREVTTDDAALRGVVQALADEHGIDLGGGGEPSEAPEPEVDRAEELREQWGTAPGQLWLVGQHRLLCGDSTKAGDVERLMRGEAAALLATDPPYNVGIDYGEETDDNKAREEYAAFTRAWFGCWQGASTRQIVTPGCNNLASWLRWFDPYHVAPWTKTNAMTNGKVSRWWCWEPILFFGAGWKRERTNDVFEVAVPPQHALGMGTLTPFHPCPKPLPMWVDLLTNYSERGEVVADAFIGSGTALVAAEQTGRRCYGMEVEPKYAAVTLERLSQMGLAPRLEAA